MNKKLESDIYKICPNCNTMMPKSKTHKNAFCKKCKRDYSPAWQTGVMTESISISVIGNRLFSSCHIRIIANDFQIVMRYDDNNTGLPNYETYVFFKEFTGHYKTIHLQELFEIPIINLEEEK